MDNPATIASKLSEAQRLVLIQGAACGTAYEMVDLGLWEPEPGVGEPYYVTTPLGKAVQAHLQDQTQ